MSQGNSSPIRKVGVIGLGIMGTGMARNLHRAGFEVVVYNRTAERSKPLAQEGMAAAASPRELASRVDAVLTVVSDIPALEAVLLGPDGAFTGARPGTLFIDSSTVTPQASRAMAEEARRRGCEFLDAPVVGSKDAARDGQLYFMAGGSEEAFRRAQPLFGAMGRGAIHMGPSGSGSAIKLVNNLIAAVTMVALSEGIMVAEAAGLNPGRVRQLLFDSVVGSPFLRYKLPKVQERDFSTQFALALMHKDVRYFLKMAGAHDRPVPVAALVGQLFRAAARAGWAEHDMSAIFAYLNQERPAP